MNKLRAILFCLITLGAMTPRTSAQLGVAWPGPGMTSLPPAAMYLTGLTDYSVGFGQTFTSTSLDSTGATLLVASLSDYQAVTASVLTDSKSNTWDCSTITARSVTGAQRNRLCFSINPTVGTGHTFTVTASGTFYPGLCVAVYSNIKTTLPFDQQNGNSNASTSTLSTNSITPGVDNELIVAALGMADATQSTVSMSSMTKRKELAKGADHFGCAIGDKNQTTATTTSETWTAAAGGNGLAASIASFKTP